MNNVVRLIEKFTPEHYDLSITLKREERLFNGLAVVSGVSSKNSTAIVLHSKKLSIHSATIDGKEASWEFGANDELSITNAEFEPGPHTVTIEFSGTITDTMHGLYPCYFEVDGVKKELLATQFESHHAREVFPCVDEPSAKATFDLTLTTETDVNVLSNMPVMWQRTEEEGLVTHFETTPRMSTYLLAWVVGEMHKKSAQTKSGVEVNIWATPAQPPASLDFALDIATRTIDFFDEYFGIPYPLPKSDHVALPDFSSGAMENWGLVTYREIALLADPKTTSVSSKHYIATVIAHELSHQWFGNLVTMKWWNDLWLNESFATLMEYIAIDALHPEWNVWLDFASNESLIALRRDSLDGVQPVQAEVAHPDEISTLFDGAIVYAKGARLLRMCEQYVGKEAFRTGLSRYFKEFAYQNTEASDLWRFLSDASGKDIASFMNSWISRPGYPVVSIERDSENITLSQQQFFVGPHAESNKEWQIPLGSNNDSLPEEMSTKSISVPLPSNVGIQLNIGDSAHFITKYDELSSKQLAQKLLNDELDPISRLQILDEQMLLARSDHASSSTLVPLLNNYQKETNEAVWSIINAAIGELKKFVEDDEDTEDKLRKLAGKIAKPLYNKLGWEPTPDESESDTKLRSTIIATMLYARDPEAIQSAIDKFDLDRLDSLDPELRPLIIGTVVREIADDDTITALLDKYKSSASSEMRDDIASGLTCSRDKDVLARLLAIVRKGDVVRQQDTTRWYAWILRNKHGRELAWKWLRDEWLWIEDKFGDDKSYDDYPRYTASALRSKEDLESYKSFFAPLANDPALSRVIAIGTGEIAGRIDLLNKDTEAVREALKNLDI